jgi:N-formylmaleamate deformylase
MFAAALHHCPPRFSSGRALALALLFAVPTTNGAAQPAPAFTVRHEAHAGQQTMILIPGLFSSADVWDGTAKHLAGRFDLHILTLAGFAGVPPLSDERFFDAERDAIVRYIKDAHLDRPILVGHSLGGALALAVGATVPDLVLSIVVVDAVPFLPALNNPTITADANRATADAIRRAYAASTPAQIAAQSGPAFRGLMRDTAHLAEAIGWSARSDPTTVGRAVADMMVTDLRTAVSAIRTPVLIVAAGGSAATPAAVDAVRAAYEAQVAGIPVHRVVVAEGARHFIMYDTPEFLFRSMDTFFKEVSR